MAQDGHDRVNLQEKYDVLRLVSKSQSHTIARPKEASLKERIDTITDLSDSVQKLRLQNPNKKSRRK